MNDHSLYEVELLQLLTRIAEALEANAKETERLARYLGDAVSVHDGQLRVRLNS